MKKKAIVKCRPTDPDHYSGCFEIEAEFKLGEPSKPKREFRLEDQRIVTIKCVGNRKKILTFYPDGSHAYDHKIKRFEIIGDT